MAINNNRIRCNAGVDATGVITVSTAISGYQLPANLWAGGTMVSGTIGTHQYVLEDGAGQWELGTVTTTGTFTSFRTVIQSNANAGAGFSNSTTGLTLSIVSDDMGTWAHHRLNLTDSPPASTGSGMAAGANSVAADTSIAVGHGAKATGTYSIAVGESAGEVTARAEAVALGSFAVAAADGAVAIGAGAIAVYAGEICLGAQAVSVLPVMAIHSGAASVVKAAGGGTINFADMALAYLAVKATIRIEDDANPGVLTHTKTFTADYHLYTDGTTCTVLGAPTITTTYTGASVGTSALTINSTTGVPQLTYTGASGTGNSRGVLVITKA